MNDAHGHDAGDRLLRLVAERMWNCVRVVDTVARFGGDEFVIVLQDFEPDPAVASAQVRAIAEKIRAAVAQPCEIAGTAQVVTCTIGATLFGAQREPTDEILRRADRCLYEAKRGGRNSVRLG